MSWISLGTSNPRLDAAHGADGHRETKNARGTPPPLARRIPPSNFLLLFGSRRP